MNIPAFFSYMFVTAVTPGPNNIMAMTNAAREGLKKGMVFCAGVFVGFFIQTVLLAVFTALLYEYVPAVEPVMKWVGAGYILFLAYTIFRDKPKAKASAERLAPSSFTNGVVMQFVNVKGILYGLTSFSSFILPYTQDVRIIAAFTVILPAMGYLCTILWALFGSIFQRFYTEHRKLMNTIFALTLVYCAVMILV